MDGSKYNEQAARTESMRIAETGLSRHQIGLLNVIRENGSAVLELADKVKKHLAYGSVLPPKWANAFHSGDVRGYNYSDETHSLLSENKQLMLSDDKARLLHAALGILTEGDELFSSVLTTVLEGGDVDEINLAEEVGDLFWYIAIIISVLDTSWEKIMDAYIHKLKTRYPERFTQEDAENRDLSSEQEALTEKL